MIPGDIRDIRGYQGIPWNKGEYQGIPVDTKGYWVIPGDTGPGSRKHAVHSCHLGAVWKRFGPWGQFFIKIPSFHAAIL